MTTTPDQRRAWPIRLLRAMPPRDRRDRVLAVVTNFAAAGIAAFVVSLASQAGWPIWVAVLTALPASGAFVAGYAVWYRRHSPAPAHANRG